jgi:hypothetical protein
MSLVTMIVTLIALIILWILVSIPVYLAGKAVAGRKATFGDAMLATLLGPIVYAITLVIVDFALGAFIGSGSFVVALFLAFLAWIWVYKASFKTSWLRGLVIAILAVIIFFILSVILSVLFGLLVPTHFFPSF